MHSSNACRQAGAHVGSPHTASVDANRARLGSTTTPFVVDALFDIPTALDPQDDPGADSAIGAPGGTREEWVEEWSEDDIVLLHWRLLQEIRHLAGFGLSTYEIARRVGRSEKYVREQIAGRRGPGWRDAKPQAGEAA